MSTLAPADKSKPILVVDAHSAMRRMVKVCLKQLGYENIAEADSTDAALQQVEQNQFTLIICDCGMPDMSASDLLRMIRNDPQRASLPIVMLANQGQKQEAERSIQLGAPCTYVVKPISAAILKSKLDALWHTD